MFSIFKIGMTIRKIRKRNELLNLYYPKHIYDPLARREMRELLTQFNDLFYEAYPEKLKSNAQLMIDDQPKTHSKKYDVQREITLLKTKKVRRKDLAKIEEFLNLKYIVEEQIEHYNFTWQKALRMKNQISNELFSSYFPELFEERILFLENIEEHCQRKIAALTEDQALYEQTIYELVHYPDSFLKDASRMIGGMVADSVKHVVDVVDQSFRRK